jgi:hypothetical protein
VSFAEWVDEQAGADMSVWIDVGVELDRADVTTLVSCSRRTSLFESLSLSLDH